MMSCELVVIDILEKLLGKVLTLQQDCLEPKDKGRKLFRNATIYHPAQFCILLDTKLKNAARTSNLEKILSSSWKANMFQMLQGTYML